MPFESDPNKPIETLLSEIRIGATEGASSASRTTTFAIAPFAALLVRLAREADATANKVVRLTWVLIILTVTLIALTALLAYKEFVTPHG